MGTLNHLYLEVNTFLCYLARQYNQAWEDRLERLRHIREQAGYSQQDLADDAGVSQHTISEIELGRRKPQGRTLRKLADSLGVEVADFFPLEQPRLPEAGLDDLEARTSRIHSIPELRRMARELKAQWRELAAYDRVTTASPSERARDMQRLAEIEQSLGIIKKRLDALDPPLCWITYRLDGPPEVQFNPNRTPTEEEEAELRSKLGDYEVVDDFALVS
jgi:transcriptional regulator with XRE-family HTH domain